LVLTFIAQSVNVGLSSAVCAVLVFIAQIYPNDRVLGITGKNVPWAYAGVSLHTLSPRSLRSLTLQLFAAS
jgi:hypothetical protein